MSGVGNVPVVIVYHRGWPLFTRRDDRGYIAHDKKLARTCRKDRSRIDPAVGATNRISPRLLSLSERLVACILVCEPIRTKATLAVEKFLRHMHI